MKRDREKRGVKKAADRSTKTAREAPSTGGAKRIRVGESYSGFYQGSSRGGGFVVLAERGLPDVYVSEERAGLALHGDKVLATVLRERPGRAPEAEIDKVLEHANKQIVGQLFRSGNVSIVRPKNPRINRLIEIPRKFSPDEVRDGAWVVAEIKSWSDTSGAPLVGSLKEVLGVEGESRLPILLLVRGEGIRIDFPEEVEREVSRYERYEISKSELEHRRDFRDSRVITIDPATAKDFDDAISIIKADASGWRVGVHIADVAHYVKPGTKLDAEAYDRATSIYPVDRVVPMLPEALSNKVCSLRPDEDKLTMSAIFTITRGGDVRDVELCESVIRSVRRFNYQEVQGLIDEVDGAEVPRFPKPIISSPVYEDLMKLREAAAALLRKRMKRGSLDLDLPETEVLFDSEGIVSDVRRKERLESHRLIEDLMIAANEAVARELQKNEIPILYRVHEPPNEDKLRALGPALGRFGIMLPKSGTIGQAELQSALEKAHQHPAGAIIQRYVLRALTRARYQPENVGHFGLASECYTHFTSPIRRYPDLIVHRAVKAVLGPEDEVGRYAETAVDQLEQWGRHTSEREERAQHIEWDAEKILTCEFMRRFIGDVFEGYISGVISRGIFIELIEYPAEGFVPIRELADDFYDLDEMGMAFYGRRTGRSYAVGDRVVVQIENIDVLQGEMRLNLIRKEGKVYDRDGNRKKQRTKTFRNRIKGRGKKRR